ncbi:MAG: hypothetical protein U9O18_06770 [Chloroflexota bacterium]|nr:hypothetical protein [Chloroflexota bacterium]
MRTTRRLETAIEPLPGRGLRRFVGRKSSLESEEMTVGTALYADEFGPMEPHNHAEETVYVLESDRAWVRWGSSPEDLPNRIDLEPGVVINTPALEWHVFEWEPGGHLEILFIYGQVDNIRPEDMETD